MCIEQESSVSPFVFVNDIVNDIVDIVCNNSLLDKLNTSEVKEKFVSELNGYHLVCDATVKEAVWEEINKTIASVGCNVTNEAKGNHKSGMDMQFEDIGISMKSAKIDKNRMSISSYRLTTVCSDKNVGVPSDIVEHIRKRDESYKYYSILAREELSDNKIHYYWCMIPKSAPVFNMDANEFRPKMGKQGKNKDSQVGWDTHNFSISFSMSSQLWFSFSFNDVKKYVIADTIVDNSTTKMSYSDIFKLIQMQKLG